VNLYDHSHYSKARKRKLLMMLAACSFTQNKQCYGWTIFFIESLLHGVPERCDNQFLTLALIRQWMAGR
jgi:hypothetical protein